MSHLGRTSPNQALVPLVALLVSTSSAGQATPALTPSGVGTRVGRTELFRVDDTPSPCRFSDRIQAAVDAARHGDVILVESGTYAPFVIDGKALCVIGVGRPLASFEVRNLGPGRSAVVRGFRNDLATPRFTGNSGPVWVEDCTWTGGKGRSARASTVGLFRTTVLEGWPGAHGFLAEDSVLVAYHSVFVGAPGVDAWFDEWLCADSGGLQCDWRNSSPGASGVALRGSGSAFLAGCSASGGRGGTGNPVFCANVCGLDDQPGSCAGNALALSGSTRATVLQTGFTGGNPDCDGTPVTGSAGLTTIAGETGKFSVVSPVRAGAPLHYRFEGPPGRSVHVTYSSEYAPVFDPEFHGMSVVPLDSPTVLVGTLPPSGVLELDVTDGDLLEPGAEARVIFMQAKLYDPISGWGVLGTPSVLVVVQDPCP